MGTYGREQIWWDGAWSAGALAVTCTPLVALPWIAYEPVDIAELAGASNVVAHVVLLFSILLLYLQWRLTDGASGWLVLTLSALSVQGLALSIWTFDDSRHPSADLQWIVIIQLALAVGVYATVALSERVTLRVDPLAAGVATGLIVGGVRRTLLSLNETPGLASNWVALLGVALLVVDLAISIAILRLTIAPSWVRWRLAGSLMLLCIAHAAMYSAPGSRLLGVMTIVAYVLGSALLLSLAAGLARTSWLDKQEA